MASSSETSLRTIKVCQGVDQGFRVKGVGFTAEGLVLGFRV